MYFDPLFFSYPSQTMVVFARMIYVFPFLLLLIVFVKHDHKAIDASSIPFTWKGRSIFFFFFSQTQGHNPKEWQNLLY